MSRENRICHFVQILTNGDNLHEMLNLAIWENMKNIVNLLSAQYAQIGNGNTNANVKMENFIAVTWQTR